jgi:Shedu protein SduA, C-terminal
VLRLYTELEALYAISRQHGVPIGEREFIPVGENVRGLLRQPEVANSLLSDDELDLVGAFVRWIDSNPAAALRRLHEEVDARDLASFDSLLAAARLRQFNDEFHTEAGNQSESFWQGFFATNSWVLARVFAHPFVLIQEQAYVGGKTIANREGSLADFLYENKLTGNVLIAEIKTPQTKLLGPEYRNRVYPVSNEVAGAVTQALHNRRTLIEEYKQRRGEGETWAAFSPRCLVVAGSVKLEKMSTDQRSSFELYRNQLRDLDLVSFDEVAARVDSLIDLLSGAES